MRKKFEGFQRGINLGGWLSQCDNTEETYREFIKEENIRQISEWGLDHIRIPVDYDLFEHENGFEHLKRGVDWARKYNLNVIVDLHKTYGYSFDFAENESGFFHSEEYQEKFYCLWEQIAKRFGCYGEHIAFELLNEVTEKEDGLIWNEIAEKCIKRIRKICPETKILIGGYYNNSVEALIDLWPPYDDNIVYNFHCYEPLIFTHQGAYWIPIMPLDFRISIDTDVKLLKEKTETVLEREMTGYVESDEKLTSEYFDRLFAEAARIADERNVALYCGEYGVIDLADPHQTVKWYQLIHQTFEKYGIGRAAWNYKEKDFGFISEHMKEVLPEIVKLL